MPNRRSSCGTGRPARRSSSRRSSPPGVGARARTPLPWRPSDSATDRPPRSRPTGSVWPSRRRSPPGPRTRTPQTTSSSSIWRPARGGSPRGRRRDAPGTAPQGSRPFPTTDRSSPSPAKPTTSPAPTISVAPMSTCATCPCTGPSGWTESANVHAGDRPADHQLLDLLGAFEEVVDLGVAVPALDGEVADVAVAAEDLDRPLGNPHGSAAGLELAHRSFGVLVALTVAGQP